MREQYEFRIYESIAKHLFAPDVGEHLGGVVRRVELSPDDPRFVKLGEIESLMRRGKDIAFTYWNVHRSYSKAELEEAELFRMKITSAFEPTGEQCGTVYDGGLRFSSITKCWFVLQLTHGERAVQSERQPQPGNPSGHEMRDEC